VSVHKHLPSDSENSLLKSFTIAVLIYTWCSFIQEGFKHHCLLFDGFSFVIAPCRGWKSACYDSLSVCKMLEEWGQGTFNQSGGAGHNKMNTYISVRTSFLLAGRCASSIVSIDFCFLLDFLLVLNKMRRSLWNGISLQLWLLAKKHFHSKIITSIYFMVFTIPYFNIRPNSPVTRD
jgi:hypothetical protein